MNKIINTTDIPLDEIMDDYGRTFAEYLDPDSGWTPEVADENRVEINLDLTPFTLPGQVTAPGETELLNMNGVVLEEKSYPTFKAWLEHNFTHRKIEVDEIDPETGEKKWYPEPIDVNGTDGKFEFIRCHIITRSEHEKFIDFFRLYFYHFSKTGNKLEDVAFPIYQQAGGLWASRLVTYDKLKKFMPRAQKDYNSDNPWQNNYIPSIELAIRPFDLYEIRKFLDLAETKYLAFGAYMFRNEVQFKREIEEAKKVLDIAPLQTVIIPYKGKKFYGHEEDSFGVF